MSDKDLHYVSEVGRVGLFVATLIGLLALAAWCYSSERVRDISEGRSMEVRTERRAVYRRCCRPRCRYVELGENQWLHVLR
jgi:hypothetical protein